MKKIALIVMLVVMAVFAGQTESGLVSITKNKYGTEMTFWPNTSIDAGHVYSVVMNDCDGFKSIEVKFMDGTVQYYSFDEEKMPSVTTKSEDRVLSWESLTKPKFLKTWDSYMKYFKDFLGVTESKNSNLSCLRNPQNKLYLHRKQNNRTFLRRLT